MHEALEELPQLADDVRARMAAALQAAIDHAEYFAFLEAPVPTFSLPLGGTLSACLAPGHLASHASPLL